jgi:hypothetical protein
LGEFKYKGKILSIVTVLALASSIYFLYSKDKSDERYYLLQEQTNKILQLQLGQVSECFGVELDDSAYSHCIAAIYAVASIPHYTTFVQDQGVSIELVMNQLYRAMLVPNNKSAVISHQAELFGLFGRLSLNPADPQLTQQVKEFIEGLKDS